jgi:hypothetical protein
MTKKNKPGDNYVRYEVITQEDENGDLFLPIPPQVLEELGWKEGTQIDIQIGENGTFYLTRKD